MRSALAVCSIPPRKRMALPRLMAVALTQSKQAESKQLNSVQTMQAEFMSRLAGARIEYA
jgi:hypothetical protein